MKQVKDVMTPDPACCTPDMRLDQVARLMVDHDCGAIPVIEDPESRRPVGVVTDRDITTRAVAQGLNPFDTAVRDCMSTRVVCVRPEDDVRVCCEKLEEHQVRRALVVNGHGECCGIVAQADIARMMPERETAELVKTVSQPLI